MICIDIARENWKINNGRVNDWYISLSPGFYSLKD